MKGTVLAAYLHPGKVSHSFSDSLMRLVAFDLAHEGRVIRTGGPVMFRCGPGGLVEARTAVMMHFLDNTEAEWLWCVDSDMGFAPDTVEKLVTVADPVERPVVGALCFALKETASDGMQGFQTQAGTTLFGWGQKPDGEAGFVVMKDYPVNTLVGVAGTGAACILIHRSAAEKVREAEGDVWFDRKVYPSGMRISEDLSFCARLGAAGVPVYVHTGIRTTHHKEFWLSESDYWKSRSVPPATEEVAVVVPVLERPANAEPFMTSLRASTGLAKVYAVAERHDTVTQAAWEKAGAEVLVGEKHTFAEKLNHGYLATKEPWIFAVGDDVHFHPGWLDHAQHIAHLYDAKVVGTNDLGHPRVMAGEHATHFLVSRAYVDETGASWDGPGVLAHEGYRHWYVDDEIVTAAKQRGVFQMAIGSLVEHLHPDWNKAESDKVYVLGRKSAAEDKKLFVGRRGSYLHEGATVGAG